MLWGLKSLLWIVYHVSYFIITAHHFLLHSLLLYSFLLYIYTVVFSHLYFSSFISLVSLSISLIFRVRSLESLMEGHNWFLNQVAEIPRRSFIVSFHYLRSAVHDHHHWRITFNRLSFHGWLAKISALSMFRFNVLLKLLLFDIVARWFPRNGHSQIYRFVNFSAFCMEIYCIIVSFLSLSA